jgi:hypothetical protein
LGVLGLMFHPCYGSKSAQIPVFIIADLHQDVSDSNDGRVNGENYRPFMGVIVE